MPLARAGVTKRDVMEFWDAQGWGLDLAEHEGNCDLCFLKGLPQKIRVAQDHPHRIDPWLADEAEIGATYRSGHGYSRIRQLADNARRQVVMFEDDGLPRGVKKGAPSSGRATRESPAFIPLFDDSLGECLCTD
jgi:hypothetical protein